MVVGVGEAVDGEAEGCAVFEGGVCAGEVAGLDEEVVAGCEGGGRWEEVGVGELEGEAGGGCGWGDGVGGGGDVWCEVEGGGYALCEPDAGGCGGPGVELVEGGECEAEGVVGLVWGWFGPGVATVAAGGGCVSMAGLAVTLADSGWAKEARMWLRLTMAGLA